MLIRCQVPDCHADLSSLRAYYLRYHICEEHCKADQVVSDGEVCRFCQLCGRFHPLAAFNYNRRSCRTRLAKHNERRKMLLERKATSADGSFRPAARSKKSRMAKAEPPDSGPETDSDSTPTGGCGYESADCRDHTQDLRASFHRELQELQEGPSALTTSRQELRPLPFNAAAPTRPPLYISACKLYKPSPLSRAAPLLIGTPEPAVSWAAVPCLPQRLQPAPFACQQQPRKTYSAPQPLRSAGSLMSQQSSASPALPALPAQLSSARSSGGASCSAASDMDADRAEAGVAELWREWGGDIDCLTRALPSTACKVVPSAGSCPHFASNLQLPDLLWQSVSQTPRPESLQLALQVSERCY